MSNCLFYALWNRLFRGGLIERGWSPTHPWLPRFYWVSGEWRYAYIPRFPMHPPVNLALFRGRVQRSRLP